VQTCALPILPDGLRRWRLLLQALDLGECGGGECVERVGGCAEAERDRVVLPRCVGVACADADAVGAAALLAQLVTQADLEDVGEGAQEMAVALVVLERAGEDDARHRLWLERSEEHTSEL